MEEDGDTRFKQHLTLRGRNVQGCHNVLSNVADYFRREIDKGQDKWKSRMAEEVWRLALAGSSRGSDNDNNNELQAILRASREEEFRRYARMSGSSTCLLFMINRLSVPTGFLNLASN